MDLAMAVNNGIEKLSENVNRIQQEMSQIGNLVDRFDVTIEKLTEVSTTISQLLAVHGNRIEFQEKFIDKLQEAMEKRRIDSESNVKDIYSKIERVEAGLHVEFKEYHDKVINRIGEIQKENFEKQEKSTQTQNEAISKIDKRTSKLEKLMWGVMVIGTILLWAIEKVLPKISLIF